MNPGKIVYTFALGSRDLYATLDRNRDMHCCPVDYTNPPHIIMQNDNVVSINNTTQIDLQGQAASESDGHRHISDTGGQLQFPPGVELIPIVESACRENAILAPTTPSEGSVK
jgi:acyl-CoA hydrolase